MTREARHRRDESEQAVAVRHGASTGTAVGLGLLLALAAWSLFGHSDAPAAPELAGTLLAGAAAWTLGCLAATIHPAAPGLAVPGLVIVAFGLHLPASLSGAAIAPPLGYANSNGALLVAAVAGLISAWPTAANGAKPRIIVAALVLTGLCLMTGSRAATVSCLLLLAVAPILQTRRAARWQAVSAAVLVLGFGTTVAVALTHSSGAPSDLVVQALSAERVTLWSDALGAASDRPLTGVGPGEFQQVSRLARSDADLAHVHSTPLRVLAELGAIGFVLMSGLVAWLIWRLRGGAILLAVLALQGLVDYVLDSVWVVVAMATVLGGVAWSLANSHAWKTTSAHSA